MPVESIAQNTEKGVRCGKEAYPQHLPIRELLRDVAAEFEK